MEQLLNKEPGKEDGRGGMKSSTSEERRRSPGNNLFTVASKTQTRGHQIQLIRRQVQNRERSPHTKRGQAVHASSRDAVTLSQHALGRRLGKSKAKAASRATETRRRCSGLGKSVTDRRLPAGRRKVPQPGSCAPAAGQRPGGSRDHGDGLKSPRSTKSAPPMASPHASGAAGSICRSPRQTLTAAAEDRGLQTLPNSLFKLKFSMLAPCVGLVFLEVSAEATQTFPKK